MNDLAEKALHGADVALRAARSRALVTTGVAGFLASCVIVFAASRVGAARATRPLTTWFGLQDTHGLQAKDPGPGAALLVAVAALIVIWLLTVDVVRRRGSGERALWGVFAAWALPFVAGPPLFDGSVYSYTAFGLLQRAGLDPYTTDASRLRYAPIVEAVDPGSRGTASSTGPLGTLLQHLAASVGVGSALGIVLVLRVVAIIAVVAIGRTAADMGARRPGRALSLTILNPLVLFYVVSGAHLEGVMAALALSAIAAANRRNWVRALVLASAAGSVVGPGFVVVLVVLAVHLQARRSRTVVSVLLRDLPVVAVTVGVLGFIVPNGFGWVRTISDQFSAHTPYSVADVTSKILSPVVRDASYDTLTASTRAATIIAMVAAVVFLLVTSGQRPSERTAGYALLAVGLLAPVLYPWYLLAGVLCVAPSGNAVRKILVLAVSSAGCLLMPGGFAERTTDVLTGIGLSAVALVTAVALRRQFRRRDRDSARSELAPAGDVAHRGPHVGEVDRDDDDGDE